MKKVIVISTSLRPGSNSQEIDGNAKLQDAYELGKQV